MYSLYKEKNNANRENEKTEQIVGLQSFSIFVLLMISGILSPYLRKVIPLAINLVSGIRGTISLIQEYTQSENNESNNESSILNVLMAYYISLILLYSSLSCYRGGFDVASDILPLPTDIKSMLYPFKYPQP
ncbi:hypothetical protein SAMN02745195_01619 [Thermoanaerobacter uzonensis DSM 18761]|uniref:Uncharacterized protein n=1 Tax=Thermoanaerobacter uzonensis DSM 18761 TaxID=1123369 RepID=A0A1M4Y1M3_9THEO|nr:hypothetical protein [Thermoanaerobacter uzonensis]SHE99734.1 hypothetical protein SAMN02745195_01619 [Thermoanaerobacter uzonensis DSM 18761]